MARYIARTRIDAGKDKDGKLRTFEPGQAVDLPQDEIDKLLPTGALVDESQAGATSPSAGGTGGTGPATANTSPDVPQAPPGSPPPEKRDDTQAAQRAIQDAQSLGTPPPSTTDDKSFKRK